MSQWQNLLEDDTWPDSTLQDLISNAHICDEDDVQRHSEIMSMPEVNDCLPWGLLHDICTSETTLIFFSLLFLISLLFAFPRNSFFFCTFLPSLPRDFTGSARIKNPCFFGGFPCRFPTKKQGEEDQGKCTTASQPQSLATF